MTTFVPLTLPSPQNGERVKVISSDELFTGGREILIRHKNDCYRLIITKSGKLILNK